MSAPNPIPGINDPAMRKAALLQAISQLDMLITVFTDAPQAVVDSAKQFRDSLKAWADQ